MSQNRAMTVVDAGHPAVQQVATAPVAAMLDNYLAGTALTGKMILTDLMVMMTENPKLQQCTPQSLFKCAVFAAQRKRSFGPYGVWIVPRELKGGGLAAVPQLSSQAKNTSAREKGAFTIQSEVVLKGEKFLPHKDGAVIVSIDHEISYTDRPLPTPQNVVAAYGVIEQHDGRRFHKVLTRNELNRSQNAAASKSGPWATDYEAMCRKTVEHRMEEDYVGDFTQYGGGVSAEAPPTLDTQPEATQGGDVADALFARAENYVPTPFERVTMMIETRQSAEEVDALKKGNVDFAGAWNECTKDEKESLAELAKARKAELAAPEQSGGDSTADPSNDPGPDEPAVAGDAPAPEAASEPEGGAAAGEPVKPPPFPALSAKIQKLMEATTGDGLRTVVGELQADWANMEMDPEAVVDLIRVNEKSKRWAGLLNEDELREYGPLKASLLAALKKAGLPHEV